MGLWTELSGGVSLPLYAPGYVLKAHQHASSDGDDDDEARVLTWFAPCSL